MNKILKKITAVALAACMTCVLGVTAFAANNNASDTGTITINGLDADVTVELYKVVKAEYNTNKDNGEFVQYASCYPEVTDFVVDRTGGINVDSDGNTVITEAVLNELYTVIETGINTGDIEADYTATSNAAGTATFTTSVGSYLVVVKDSESATYALMIASAYYDTNEDGTLKIEDGTVNVLGDNAWIKSATPTIDKEVKTDTMNDTWGHGGDAELGDVVEFEILVDNIPHFAGKYPMFIIADSMDEGFTLTSEQFNAIEVYFNDTLLTKNVDYTISQTSDGFEINFVVNGTYTLNNYVSDTAVSEDEVKVDFFVTVNENMYEDKIANNNNAVLTYSPNSSVYGEKTEITDEARVYTFDIDGTAEATQEIIRKVGTVGGEFEKYLDGAGFTLYHDADCTQPYTNPGASSAEVITSGLTGRTVVEGENGNGSNNGYMSWYELEEGTYYLKETTAPDGYVLNETVYRIDISAKYDVNGYLTSWEVITTDTSTNQQIGDSSFTITYTDGVPSVSSDVTTALIPNEHVGELPSMGGSGTAIFTAVGCALILAAIAGVVVYRKKTAA